LGDHKVQRVWLGLWETQKVLSKEGRCSEMCRADSLRLPCGQQTRGRPELVGDLLLSLG
jgi:hypothetical protein